MITRRKNKMKMGVAMRALLIDNETAYRHPKRTPKDDKELLILLAQHLPYSKGVKSMIVKDKLTINSYRNKMNSGHWGPPLWPPSFRYNEGGKRVNGRSGKRLLTTEDQQSILRRLINLQREYRAEINQELTEEEIKKVFPGELAWS